MWRCLVEENVRAGQVSDVGCENEHRPMVVNDRLEENYERKYKDIVKKWWLWLNVGCWFQGYS